MNHGLPPQTLREIHRVLATEPEVESAILYGSRAKGTHRHGSDIDLVLTGAHLTSAMLGKIAFAFDESPLPYRFDVAILERITNPALVGHIQRVGIPIYERATVESR